MALIYTNLFISTSFFFHVNKNKNKTKKKQQTNL